MPVLARPHNLVPREPFSFRRKTLVTRLSSPLTESLETDTAKILKLELKDSGKKEKQYFILLIYLILFVVYYGPWFDHVLSWWKHKDDPDVLILKYEDMKEVSVKRGGLEST